ncbi:trypsin-1 [Lepeophtheirus salmonis]|uniref:trypsin-1 n=1 Tax=Lepeophtheirus salmonis TaxID=72036 RepID=UPI001AE9814B|nr:trypsin-1-like [Lepeophtheirus salmonis]
MELKIMILHITCMLLALSLKTEGQRRKKKDIMFQGDGKIVGGNAVKPNSIPYQISFQLKSGFHFCGGSIIDKDTVLTAAHCCQNFEPEEVQIVAGEHNLSKVSGIEQIANVSFIKYHEDYATKGTNNDICLLKLESSLEFNDKVDAVNLPRKNKKFKGNVRVSGWGSVTPGGESSDFLRSVDVKIMSFAKCNLLYLNALDKSMLCAGARRKDSCQGDSGGPLTKKNTLVGVVSWGIGCASPWFPGVYTKVSKFIDWIQANK